MIGTTPIPKACEATKANSVTISTLLAGFSKVYKTPVIVGSAPHWYRDQRNKQVLLSTNDGENVVTGVTKSAPGIL